MLLRAVFHGGGKPTQKSTRAAIASSTSPQLLLSATNWFIYMLTSRKRNENPPRTGLPTASYSVISVSRPKCLPASCVEL